MTTAIDLFAGLGGWSTGARMAGVEVLWAANHWPAAVEWHSQNHPDAIHVCQDLHQADWTKVPSHDILLASPCCQGHSKARGKASGNPQHDASRSTAWAVAGTSERGHCPDCGARWVRKVSREFVPQQDVSAEKGVRGHGDTKPLDATNTWQGFARGNTRTATTGWRPGCSCGVDPVPDVVLDPFGGSGTTAGVAIAHGRSAVLCELNPEYAELMPARVDSILATYGKARRPTGDRVRNVPKPDRCLLTVDLFGGAS